MRKTESLPLVVGLPGTTVTDDDRALLERVRPAGVILFSRNIETPDQVRELVSGLQDLEPRPFVTADLEGGMVNRLSALWGDLRGAGPRRGGRRRLPQPWNSTRSRTGGRSRLPGWLSERPEPVSRQ